jgi:hypothetical protein
MLKIGWRDGQHRELFEFWRKSVESGDNTGICIYGEISLAFQGENNPSLTLRFLLSVVCKER